MAKSTKSARNIVVGDIKYHWRASGNDGFISLVIWPQELAGATIVCTFDYDQTEVPLGEGRVALTRQIVVTSRLVRRVIEYAVRERGYDPRTKAEQLTLGKMDELIDTSDALRSE